MITFSAISRNKNASLFHNALQPIFKFLLKYYFPVIIEVMADF